MNELKIFKDTTALNQNLAQYVVDVANQAIATKGRFDFVLTGGSSPKALYQLLSTTYAHKINWDKAYFFFGDERTVPATHKDYNGLMAKENLFDNLNIPQQHIFYIDTTLAPNDAAKAYKARLDAHFNAPIVFDMVLLGMGDDAHTASIFPGTDLVNHTAATVASVFVQKLDTYRISLTAPLINQAKHIAFITFGANKAEALKNVFGQNKDVNQYPAQLIAPQNGTLAWFTDEAAAALIS